MKRETRVAIFKDVYQCDIPDEELYDEAIATLESYFEETRTDIVYGQSRIYAIAYLALLAEREEK